jgi:aminoglycoside 6'-N-acetyltransferase I
MVIRAFQPEDWAAWCRMRRALWPDATPSEHEAEMWAWLERPDTGILVCPRPAGGLCGFAEVSTQSYADGCDTSPVAFLEGWYVDTYVRRQGVGRALVEAVVNLGT